MQPHSQSAQNKTREIAVLELPFEGGQPRKGTAKGPRLVRELGLSEELQSLGWTLANDVGPLNQKIEEQFSKLNQERTVSGKVKNSHAVSEATRITADAVAEQLNRNRFVVNIGGDHSLAIGTISGVAKANPNFCVLWIDAHADINTLESTNSGNVHGMPISLLMGITEKLPDFDWVKPVLSPDRIAYIGLRDVEAGEKSILRKHNIRVFSMHEVDKYGIGKVVELALQHINPNNDRQLHLSFDIDAMDPAAAPSTGTPVRGGLTFREGCFICESAWRSGALRSVDLMELNPTVEPSGSDLTARTAIGLLKAACGDDLL